MLTTTQLAPAVKPDQPSTRHLLVGQRYAGALPEPPRERWGCIPRNSPARDRGSDTSSGAAVDSLRGVQVDADALDRLAARMGV